MTRVTHQPMTFQAYLNYGDGTDTHYELVNGELVTVPPEDRLNSKIALWLRSPEGCVTMKGVVCV